MFLVPLTRSTAVLSRGFDRFFDARFDRSFAAADGARPRSPALDVAESDGKFVVTLDMPGVAKEDVKVSIEGRRVSIEAQARSDEEKKDGDRIVYRERSQSSYARSFTLASEVNQDESIAKLENGVLTLTLSKRDAATSKRISVN
jgi:HSP20 family protein